MIELTDEQKELLFNEHLSFAENVVPHKKALAHLVSNIGNLLTTAQLQQLCEAHGGSYVQWHEFDADDKLTHPAINGEFLIQHESGRCFVTMGFICSQKNIFPYGLGAGCRRRRGNSLG